MNITYLKIINIIRTEEEQHKNDLFISATAQQGDKGTG